MLPEMSQSTTSGGGRFTWRLRVERSESRRRGAGSARMVARRSTCDARRVRPRGAGSRRRSERQRRVCGFPAWPASISAALIASKSICWSRSLSDTVSTASISCFGGSGAGRCSRGAAIASAMRRAPGGGAFRRPLLGRLQQRHGGGGLGQRRVAPELDKGLVEQVFVLVAVHHGGAQRGADLGTAADIDQGDARSAAASISAGPTGRPARRSSRGEVHDVGGQRAAGCRPQSRGALAPRPPGGPPQHLLILAISS